MLYDGLPGDVCDREHGVKYVTAKESVACGGHGGAGGRPALPRLLLPGSEALKTPGTCWPCSARPEDLRRQDHLGQTPLTEDKADGDSSHKDTATSPDPFSTLFQGNTFYLRESRCWTQKWEETRLSQLLTQQAQRLEAGAGCAHGAAGPSVS